MVFSLLLLLEFCVSRVIVSCACVFECQDQNHRVGSESGWYPKYHFSHTHTHRRQKLNETKFFIDIPASNHSMAYYYCSIGFDNIISNSQSKNIYWLLTLSIVVADGLQDAGRTYQKLWQMLPITNGEILSEIRSTTCNNYWLFNGFLTEWTPPIFKKKNIKEKLFVENVLTRTRPICVHRWMQQQKLI